MDNRGKLPQIAEHAREIRPRNRQKSDMWKPFFMFMLVV